MSDESSKFSWASAALDAAGILVVSVFVGLVFMLAMFTAIDTVVGTQINSRRTAELEQRIAVLETKLAETQHVALPAGITISAEGR